MLVTFKFQMQNFLTLKHLLLAEMTINQNLEPKVSIQKFFNACCTKIILE